MSSSQVDSIIRQSYLNRRHEAYENDDNLFFINILNYLIEHSPNHIMHIDNLMKIKNEIYYTNFFKDIYEQKNLDLYFGTNRTLKSKEMILLELYFI